MNKAPVQAYADRISGIFTPVIILLGEYQPDVYASKFVSGDIIIINFVNHFDYFVFKIGRSDHI